MDSRPAAPRHGVNPDFVARALFDSVVADRENLRERIEALEARIREAHESAERHRPREREHGVVGSTVEQAGHS